MIEYVVFYKGEPWQICCCYDEAKEFIEKKLYESDDTVDGDFEIRKVDPYA